jgi:membrane-bound ClpP family serine protease
VGARNTDHPPFVRNPAYAGFFYCVIFLDYAECIWYTFPMFGIILIIVGIIILLDTFGVLAGIPSGVVWGTALIILGIIVLVRREARRRRRARWIEAHKERRVAGAAEE